jgi:predicted NAD/FAD-binding protein/CRP-like cAMP-binding protein
VVNVAVIGGGAAGIGAAWELTRAGCRVTVFERQAHLGGSCLAAKVGLGNGKSIFVDVGLSEFNRATFVNLGALFAELGLKSRPINEDISFMRPDGSAVWCTNAGQMRFYTRLGDERRFKSEVARFRNECTEVLEDATFRDFTLARYLDARGYTQEFREFYLYPRAQGTFAMPDQSPQSYGAAALVAVWQAQGIVGPAAADRHVLEAGMHSYGSAIAAWLRQRGGEALLQAEVTGIARGQDGVRVRFMDAAGRDQTCGFDHAVLAVCSHQVVPLLDDASEEEKQTFEGFLWRRVRVVVHQDARLMPDNRQGWAAYNYVMRNGAGPEARPTISFYPNRLAGLPAHIPDVFVTVNPFREPERDKILSDQSCIVPLAGTSSEVAFARVEQMQGRGNVWFCGSYLARPWVPEQAFTAGLQAADRVRHRLLIHRRPEDSNHVDELLRAIPLFDGLENAALADVQTAASLFSVEAEKVLFRQNDESDGVYLIARGRVRVATRVPGDEMVDIIEIGAGGILGEFCLLDGGRRSATARAAEPTSGFFLSLQRFDSLRRDRHPSALQVIDRIRVEVAHRARSVAEAIAAEPVLPGITTLRPFAETRSSSSPVEIIENRPDGLENLLAKLRSFSAFDSQGIRFLLAMCDCLRAPRGALLCKFAAPPDFMFIVLRGALRASLPRGGHLEQLLIYGPGDFAGTLALIDGGATHAELEAREDTLALRMQRRNFEAMRKGYAEVGCKLFDEVNKQLARDLRRLNRHLGLVRAIRRFNEHQKVRHV